LAAQKEILQKTLDRLADESKRERDRSARDSEVYRKEKDDIRNLLVQKKADVDDLRGQLSALQQSCDSLSASNASLSSKLEVSSTYILMKWIMECSALVKSANG
jgi:predicted  nucleic acid-binding Zn-ribbon protein